ncbi:MAG: YjcZ family sporulation protein [Bacillaceae bacterium]|nr:YjcZ family sporulation protein [Bacillaceae bacterium]
MIMAHAYAGGFALVVVLFILLVIIGASWAW